MSSHKALSMQDKTVLWPRRETEEDSLSYLWNRWDSFGELGAQATTDQLGQKPGLRHRLDVFRVP